MNDIRLRPIVAYPEEPASVDKAALPPALVIGDFGSATTGEIPIDSVEDLCRAFQIHAKAKIRDLEGKPRAVEMPVTGPESFSDDGLTKGCTYLRDLFVMSHTADALAEQLDAAETDLLTEDQEAELRRVLVLLEHADKEGQ